MSSPQSENHEYQVVARRYRPQVFADLIGQEHVAKSLSSAIENHRIGHAYLFTGARGVGKTSSARIFAKALNCMLGPTPTPCNVCEICQGVSAGEDIDVLEIDGASNRGIDEIRTLRQNVNVRPTRARFKIYIIDEVHMLTREAFNALLKTLEEPPEHVKFIFCTTEPGKIPITILSRCQRFDFAGINTPEIADRLMEIVTSEGLTAEPEAIMLLARRAAGSMRDGQSLLEQLLSFVTEKITVQDVHQMLGTADEDVLLDMLGNIVSRNTPGVLQAVDALVQQGSDPGLILEQLFGYFRDLLAMQCGCGAEVLLFATAESESRVRDYASALGIETILAAMQISDQTLARLKLSTQPRLLVEMSLIRICMLKDLDRLAEIVVQFQKEAAGTVATSGSVINVQVSPQAEPAKKIAASPFVPTRSFSQEVRKTEPQSEVDTPDVKKNVVAALPETLPETLPEMDAETPAETPAVMDAETPPDDVLESLREEPAAQMDFGAIFREALRGLKPGHFEDLCDYQSVFLDENTGTMTIVYPFVKSFAVNRLKTDGEFSSLQNRLSASAGRRVTVVFEVEAAPQASVPLLQERLEKPPAAPLHHPLIEAVESHFGGEIVRTEKMAAEGPAV